MRLIGKRWATAQKLAFAAAELAQNQATDVAQIEDVESAPPTLKSIFT